MRTTNRYRRLQRLAWIAGAPLLLLATSSFSLVDEFVLSGDYARARALIADCNRVFIPALDPADREVQLASVGFVPAGRELRYSLRPLEVRPEDVHIYDADEYAWIGDRRGRLDSYEAADGSRATTVASAWSADGATCQRLIITVDPAVLQVGIRQTSVRTTARLLNEFSGIVPSNYEPTLTTQAIEPGSGTVHVQLFEGGQPVPDEWVLIHTDARGLPGRYGQTLAHEHIVHQHDTIPTILLQGQEDYGQQIMVRTDFDGLADFWIDAGYRGGVEAIIGRAAELDMPPAARAVVVRHGEFRHFASVFGFAETPAASDEFPFLLTGWTDRHYYNHWVRGDLAGLFAATFRQIWIDDLSDEELETPQYLVLNDMSLEYGGSFHLGSGDFCSAAAPPSSGHHTHSTGVDFDVSPCYTVGADGQTRVAASACETGNFRKIDERILLAHVVGRLRGVVLEHRQYGPGADGVPYHNHIRFPDPR